MPNGNQAKGMFYSIYHIIAKQYMAIYTPDTHFPAELPTSPPARPEWRSIFDDRSFFHLLTLRCPLFMLWHTLETE
jgi:hypothetical protein